MIDPMIVQHVDEILDAKVSTQYKDQPLAQDWARVSKVIEEAGEAVSELISYTGQNPRKQLDESAWTRLMQELADTALTAVYAIQHFTKDVRVTEGYLTDAQDKHHSRLCDA
jgi:NTP pyrophosphatase (non-canonical NTP hydrolase)